MARRTRQGRRRLVRLRRRSRAVLLGASGTTFSLTVAMAVPMTPVVELPDVVAEQAAQLVASDGAELVTDAGPSAPPSAPWTPDSAPVPATVSATDSDPTTTDVIRTSRARRTAPEAAPVGDMGLPGPASRAYRQAAAVLADQQPGCNLSWSLLAGVGLMESDHGRYDGAILARDGRSWPAIVGLPLNGVGPVAAIPDSDGGRLDGDTQWDRAVGPMQFIPQTWAAMGADGDGDGVSDPNDLDDAALAAGTYLCAGGGDLADGAARRVALLSYNASEAYAYVVASYADDYAAGNVPTTPTLPTTLLDEDPDESEPAAPVESDRGNGAQGERGSEGDRGTGTGDGSDDGTGSGRNDDGRGSGDRTGANGDPGGPRPDRPRVDPQRADRPQAERPRSERPHPDKPADRPEPDRQKADRQKADRPEADRPEADRQKADRPEADRQKADRPEPEPAPERDRPKPDRPKADRPKADPPKADRPEPDRPKPDRPKPDRPKPDRPKPDRPEPDPVVSTRTPTLRGALSDTSGGWTVDGESAGALGSWSTVEDYDGNCRTRSMNAELRGLADGGVGVVVGIEQTLVDGKVTGTVPTSFDVPAQPVCEPKEPKRPKRPKEPRKPDGAEGERAGAEDERASAEGEQASAETTAPPAD